MTFDIINLFIIFITSIATSIITLLVIAGIFGPMLNRHIVFVSESILAYHIAITKKTNNLDDFYFDFCTSKENIYRRKKRVK